MSDSGTTWLKPGWILQHVMNPIIRWTGAAATLTVRGRASGKARRIPVNVLDLEGDRYLVSARGESEWVRNLRAAGGGEIRRGFKRTPFTATEVAVAERPPIIAAYRDKWDSQVKQFYETLPDASQHPVFRINTAG